MKTLHDILCDRAHSAPSAPAYRFFEEGAAPPFELSNEALWQQAAALAARMQAQGLQREPVLLIGESQRAFVIGFYACLMAGAIAVPTAPPRRAALLGRLTLLAQDAGARFVLSDCDSVLQGDLGAAQMVRCDLREALAAPDSAAWAARLQRPVLDANSVAFLQYTSGSTGNPKGVVVTHGNLVHNCAVIREGMDISETSSVLTALPLFHDMGLIGGVLQSMYAGCVGHFMTPAEFVQYPERWLQRIAAFGITTSGGPNFMFEHAAREIDADDLGVLDLSAWRVAFCGAEPIRAATIARFTERFAAHRFQGAAFYPCYGMAEATLFITGAQVGTLPALAPHQGSAVVGCGQPRRGTELAIVDPDTLCRVAPGCEGEIWTAGASNAQGYWKRAQLSERIFGARIRGEQGGPFLRTGDLGFLHDGQLFVTGRLKDLIILYGKKYVPQDIELAAGASHAALRSDGGAAFSVVVDGQERLVLVHELERSWVRRTDQHPQVLAEIRRAVSTSHALQVDDVVLIRPGALPRTSSGKVRRAQCQADYLNDALAPASAQLACS